MRATSRRSRPPKERSSRGALAFLLAVIALGAVIVVVGRPLAVDALVGIVADHDSLLRQPTVRALIAPRLGSDIDLAADLAGTPRTFIVDRGETAARIAARLKEAGFIRSALAFEFVLYESGRESALQSGTYNISSALTPRVIAKVFEKAPGEQSVLRIIEGWRLTEVAAAVNRSFPAITPQAFVAAAVVGERKNAVLAGLPPTASLEGYLFPDTYFFRPDATAAQLVDSLLSTFEQRVGGTLRTAAAERKTTVYDLMKLASLVEREAQDRSESPTIAGVYANRLRINMKLDADPTIQYALGDWRDLSLDDLKISSPYNTYQVAGLPPTPICNPGSAALEGAAHPANVPYFYFVAKGDGTGQHAFATTLEEHEANRVKYGNR